MAERPEDETRQSMLPFVAESKRLVATVDLIFFRCIWIIYSTIF